MTGTTNHYKLDRLTGGDDFATDGWKYTDADRQQIDRLLYQGAEGHHHNGVSGSATNPTTPLTTVLSLTGGSLPPSTRIYYKYTWVDVNGFESTVSPETYVDTPNAIQEPGPGTLTFAGGGTLLAGVYYYILSAYTNVNTSETKALSPAYITLPPSSTYSITIQFPTLPVGASGYNIFVKKPGGLRYNYLTSVDMTAPTPPTSFTDTGLIVENPNRTVLTTNLTHATNEVTLYLPDPIPAGATWKLYRTFLVGNYTNSLLHWVVEETYVGSGVIVTSYQDLGAATFPGAPPITAQNIGSPSKIDLTDAAEVTGRLPVGRIQHPQIVTFFWPGAVAAPVVGTMVWVNEFPKFQVYSVRATLGLGSAPFAQPVIIDVNKAQGATPVPVSIFSSGLPQIPVGSEQGARVAVDQYAGTLDVGDMLTVDIDQAGGGSTPTDRDLTISIFGIAYGFDANNSNFYTTNGELP